MTLPREQLEREKTRALIIAILELILGATMLFIGFQFFNLYSYIQYSMVPTLPKEAADEYNLILSVVMASGFFVVFHGIKRIADNLLNAWARSYIPKDQS